MSQQDEFTYDKGIKDDYDGVILDAWFGVPEGGGDRVNLMLKKLADDGEEVEDRYPVGADWASFDGGKTVEHPTKGRLRNDSGVAELMTRAFDAGAEDVIRERSAANEHLGPKSSQVWPGLKFHWEVVSKPYSFKDQKTGEMIEGTSNRSYPTKYLGLSDATATSSTASSTGGDNSAASTADPLASVDAAIATKLKILAQTKPYIEWVDEALALQEVRDSDTLMSALSDEGFYNKLKG